MNQVKYFVQAELKKISSAEIKLLLMVFTAMIFVSAKLLCNPLFFRQVEINFLFFTNPLKLNSSAFIYPAIYIISDAIVFFSNKKTGIAIALFGILCDGTFSYVTNLVTHFPIPHQMSVTELLNTQSINNIGGQMWKLYYYGAAASVVAAIAEILIFSALFNKSKNFLISTVTSVVITLVVHNLITDYQILYNEPDVWRLIIDNWMVNFSILFTYGVIIYGLGRLLEVCGVKVKSKKTV